MRALKAKAAESISPSRSGDPCRESPRDFNITAAPLAACRSYKISQAEYSSRKIYSKKRHQKGSSIGIVEGSDTKVTSLHKMPCKPRCIQTEEMSQTKVALGEKHINIHNLPGSKGSKGSNMCSQWEKAVEDGWGWLNGKAKSILRDRDLRQHNQ